MLFLDSKSNVKIGWRQTLDFDEQGNLLGK